jgi:hypothetical protein
MYVMDIPHRFHFIWLGGLLPEKFVPYVRSWQEVNGLSWKYKNWGDEVLKALWIPDELYPYLHNASAYAPGFEGQFKADILRYLILLRYGGVYVDVDFEAQKPLAPLLEGVQAFAAWEEEPSADHHGWINNAIMGCVPGHPWMKQVVENLPARIEEMHRAGVVRPNIMTSPQYLTPQTLEFQKNGGEVTVFSKKMFYPYLHNELHRITEEFPDAVAVHHWNNARRKTEEVFPIAGVVEAGSGKASTFMRLSDIPQGHWDELGYIPFPGTLNLNVGEEGRGWVTKLPGGVGKSTDNLPGPYWPICLRAGKKVYNNAHVRVSRSKTTVEVVAPVNLRQALGVYNGDEVTLDICEGGA